MTFESYATTYIAAALERVPAELVPGVYVVSLYCEPDDPRYPTATIGFNTEARVAEATATASGPDEARWNYAFWLQNDLGVLGDRDHDPEGARLSEQWLRAAELWYSDEEEEADFEAAMQKAEPIQQRFYELLVSTVQQLHADGTIERIFGRTVPVLIHELEYYDEILALNERANPSGSTAGFGEWVQA